MTIKFEDPSAKSHWDSVYKRFPGNKVSWYQKNPTISLNIIEKISIAKNAPILDAGCGTSSLVDQLLLRGYSNITLLDISSEALSLSRQRLGPESHRIKWHQGDVTLDSLPEDYILWHDRAVFHFLVYQADRQSYVSNLKRALKKDGHLVMATFALSGPIQCSGLKTVQYNSEKLGEELGPNFQLVETIDECHAAPSGANQLFSYFHFVKQK